MKFDISKLEYFFFMSIFNRNGMRIPSRNALARRARRARCARRWFILPVTRQVFELNIKDIRIVTVFIVIIA